MTVIPQSPYLTGVRRPRRMKSSSGFRFFVPLDGKGRKLQNESFSEGFFFAMLLINILFCGQKVRKSTTEKDRVDSWVFQQQTFPSIRLLSNQAVEPGYFRAEIRLGGMAPAKTWNRPRRLQKSVQRHFRAFELP